MSVYHNIYRKNFENKYTEIKQETNANSFTIFQNYLSTVVNSFKWGNVPILRQGQVEEFLVYWARVAFFDDNGEYKIYPCFPSGTLLENGEYDMYTIIAKNGKQWIKHKDEIEICYNNFNIIPSIYFIEELAKKSAYSLQAVDVALERAIQPPILKAKDESQMKMISEMLDKEKNKMPFRSIFSNDANQEPEILHIFDNRANDVLSLWDVYVRYRNLFYTTFGINNVEIQKRERLTEAEGSGNDEITRYTLLNDMYEQRENFINRVKEHFGYELTVEINRDSATVYQIIKSQEDKIADTEISISKGANIALAGGEGNENTYTEG